MMGGTMSAVGEAGTSADAGASQLASVTEAAR